jgi:putative NIF3 family GTP cyclohydrolase 1 type 2
MKMKIKEIYELAIKKGIESDPRGKKDVMNLLKKENEKFKELSKEKKEEYDKENLKNPYSDTRVLYGELNKDVKTILAGIDLGVAEVLLADRLNEKGKKIELLLSHHPSGKALVKLHKVMDLQADIWHRFGVPINIAEGILTERIKEVQRTILPANYNQAVDAARILKIPYICIHTPADNLVTNFLQKFLNNKKPYLVSDVLKFLKQLPEYKDAAYFGAGPTVIQGNEDKRAGKILVDMTGGTSGPKEMIEKLSNAGVGTLVCMHVKEESRKEAKKHHINIIIAGHMASDSLGLNLFLDELEKKEIEIISCSGLKRVKRI